MNKSRNQHILYFCNKIIQHLLSQQQRPNNFEKTYNFGATTLNIKPVSLMPPSIICLVWQCLLLCNVIVLSIIKLCKSSLSGIIYCVNMMSSIMPSVLLLSIIMLCVIMLGVHIIILSVNMLCAIT